MRTPSWQKTEMSSVFHELDHMGHCIHCGIDYWSLSVYNGCTGVESRDREIDGEPDSQEDQGGTT